MEPDKESKESTETSFICCCCKSNFETKKLLFDHCTETGPVKCKKSYESKTLTTIGIPKNIPRIDLTGILSTLKSFKI